MSEEIERQCDMCGHEPHDGKECSHVTGYDHLNGDHDCGCPGSLEALLAAARAEALEVAALILQGVVDYWSDRPLHAAHIYADLFDVLTGIRADAEHNRSAIPPVPSDAGGRDD